MTEVSERKVEVATRLEEGGDFVCGYVAFSIPTTQQRHPVLTLTKADSSVDYLGIDGELFEPLAPRHFRNKSAVETTVLDNSGLTPRDQEAMYKTTASAHIDGNSFSKDLSFTPMGQSIREAAARLRILDGKVFTPSIGPIIKLELPPIREGQEHDSNTSYYAATALEKRDYLGQWITGDHALRDYNGRNAIFGLSHWQDAQALADARAEIYRVERNILNPRRVIQVHDKAFPIPDSRPIAVNALCDSVLRHALQRAVRELPRPALVLLASLRAMVRAHRGRDILHIPYYADGLSISNTLPASAHMVEVAGALLSELDALPHKGRETMEITQYKDLLLAHDLVAQHIPDEDLDAVAGLTP